MSLFISYLLGEADKPVNWEDLHSEYVSLRENKNSTFIIKLMTEITYLKTKYNLCEKIAETLIEIAKHERAELIDISGLTGMLKDYGYRAEYNLKNKSTFTRDVKIVLSGIKKLTTTWQRKEEELAEYQKKYAGKEVQRKDFYVWAVTLSKYFGYRVDLEAVTVSEWCEMLNQYERYCEVQNAENTNQLNKPHGRR
jgi:hypothetical protein